MINRSGNSILYICSMCIRYAIFMMVWLFVIGIVAVTPICWIYRREEAGAG
jgi:hypothetical protein